jgi:hypothetical protein
VKTEFFLILIRINDFMKIVKWETLLETGEYSLLPEYELVSMQIKEAIKSVVWPPDSEMFTIYPESGKRRGEGNGVKPIKNGFTNYLSRAGWQLEARAGRGKGKGSHPGAFDCHYAFNTNLKPFVIEWETGNISSSHRAINRIALGILKGWISGGILVVPSENLAQYLTDRIGNEPELRPYVPLWKKWETLADVSYLGIITIEHDSLSKAVPKIPKGTDGRALQ